MTTLLTLLAGVALCLAIIAAFGVYLSPMESGE